MPRRPRLDEPGRRHHLTARGNGRSAILRTLADKTDLRDILSVELPRNNMRCLLWTMMRNHYHIIVETGDVPLSTVARIVHTRFARSYNRRHRRSGYVFQGRFHSRVVESDEYLHRLMAYVAFNPVAARVVASLDELATYPWSGYAAMLGAEAAPFHDVAGALSLYGSTRASARANLVAAVAELYGRGASHSRHDETPVMLPPRTQADEPLHGVMEIGARIEFLEGACRELQSRSARRELLRKLGWGMDELIGRACARLGADARSLRHGCRRRPESRARAVVAYVACDVIGERPIDVARATGVSVTAVALARTRGRELADDLRMVPLTLLRLAQ